MSARILALDLGLKRIGLALRLENINIPLDPIMRKNRTQASEELKKLLKSLEIEALIIGVPLGSPQEEEFRRRIAHFVSLLDFKGELFLVDESFSSKEAKLLKKSSKKKDGKLDSLSALIILERFKKC